MTQSLNVALIADIHHGIDVGTKLGSAAITLMRPFVDWVNALGPDLVVELGDRINDLDKEADLRWTKEVARVLSAVEAPCVHILGNHDHKSLTRAESEEAMQTPFTSSSRDVNGYHLVFWNSSVVLDRGTYHLSAADLGWLAADLADTGLPTIVFSHLPLDNGSMLGNFYFEKLAPHAAHYAEGANARDVIERSGKVVACIAGHTHWNQRHTIDGVHYVTIHSLTESFTTHPYPTGAHAILSVGEHLAVEVFGRDPAFYRLPVKPLGYHWQSLHRDFAPRPVSPPPPPRCAVRGAGGRGPAGGT